MTPGSPERHGVPAHRNPFSAGRVEALPYRFPEGWDWERLEQRLADLGHRAALVGPEGHGKTTLLEQLGERLAARGFELRGATLRRGQRRLPSGERQRWLADLGPRVFLLLEGAEELGRWPWWRLRRRSLAAGGLLITIHQEGLLPTLLRCETSPELLEDLVRELLEKAPASAPKSLDELDPPLDLPALYRRHSGNVREALWELYDRWAGRGSPRYLPPWTSRSE